MAQLIEELLNRHRQTPEDSYAEMLRGMLSPTEPKVANPRTGVRQVPRPSPLVAPDFSPEQFADVMRSLMEGSREQRAEPEGAPRRYRGGRI
jgi:hypothetical protein